VKAQMLVPADVESWGTDRLIRSLTELRLLVMAHHWTKETCPTWVLVAWDVINAERLSRGEQLTLFRD